MRGEIDIQKYSRLLGEGLFADNIIISLLDYKEKHHLESKEKKALKRAKVFLNEVLEGGKLQDGIFSSEDDVSAAKAFNSVQTKIKIRGVKDLLSYITGLRNSVEKILNNNRISEQELSQLDDFFSSYSCINFQKVNAVLEAV